MLLALFSDFWTLPWPGGVIPPVVIPSPTNAGSGQEEDYPQVDAWPDRAHEDYWDAREAFLMRNTPQKVPEVAKHIPAVVKKVETHNRALALAARVHLSKAHLINLESMLQDIKEAVARQLEEQAMDDEAIEILLLL